MPTNNSTNTPSLITPGYILIGTGTTPITGPISGTNGISVEFANNSIVISGADVLGGTPLDNYVAVGTGTALTYVYVGTGQLLIGTGTQPVGAPLTAGTGILISSSSGSITIAASNGILGGTPIDNYVAVGTGTALTYVYVGTGQLLIGTGTQPVGAPLTAGTGILISSSSGSITIAASNSLLGGTPIDNYVAVGTGTALTYVYVGTGQLLIGTGTQPVGAPLTSGAGIGIYSTAGAISIYSTFAGIDSLADYVAVGTGTFLTYVFVPTGQLLIGTGTRPVGAPLTSGAGIGIYSTAGAISIYSTFAGIDSLADYVAVGTGTFLTYVFVPTGQLLIGTGTRPVGAPLTSGAGIGIYSTAGAISIYSTFAGIDSLADYVAVGTGTFLTYVFVPTGQLLIGTGTRPVGAPLTSGAGIGIYSTAGAISIYSTFAGIDSLADYVAVGTGTFLTYVFVPTGQLLIGTGTRPVGAPLTAGANVSITSSAGSITISAADPGLSGTPIDNYVAVGTGTNLTYVYVGTGQLLIGTGTQPVGALLTAGTNIIITSSAGSITIASIDTGLTGTPIDNYVAVGTGTNLTYVYVGTGQLLIGTGTQPVGAPLTAGANVSITSSAGSITISAADPGLSGTPIDNYVAVGTGTNLTYVYVGTGQLLIGTGTQPVGALLTAGTNIIITSSAGSITIASIDTGLTGTPIDNYVAVGTGTNLTYVYVGTGQLLIGTGTQPVGAPLTAGANVSITSSAGSITISAADPGLSGTPIDNYVAVGTGTNLTYVYVGTGQLLIGTGTQPVGAPLTAGANVSITSSAGSITISAADPGLSGTPIDNYVAVGTGTNLTYVYVGTGQLLIGTGTQPVGAPLTAGANVSITSSAGSITISAADPGLSGTPIDNYVAVGTGTNLTYVYVGTGQLLIGTGTQPVGAPLTAGANVSITSSAGSITISAADPGLSGTPIDNYVAVGTGTNLTYVYVGTGQLLIGTGTQPVGAPLTAGANVSITSSAGSITISAADPGLSGTPIDNYVAVGTGTNLTYVYVGTGQLLIGTGTQPVGAPLTAGANVSITSSAGSITISAADPGLSGTPIDNYVAVGTGTNLTYVYVGTGQLLIGTGTQPVGAPLTAGANVSITSSAGSITISAADPGLSGTPIDNYVAVGTGTNLTYVYVGTGQLLIGTGTQPVGAPLTAGANVSITSSAGSITISAADPGLSGTPIDNYVAVGTGTNLTYVYVGTGQLLIGTGTQPVGAPLTAGANVSITSSAGSITISAADPGLSGTPIDNYVAVGTGTNLTYVYVGTGQLLIGTGTQPVGAPLTAGANVSITSSAGSITISAADPGLSGTPIDNYVAVGTGTNLTYIYVGTGQLLIGTGTQPVGAPLTAGANVSITSSAGSITISAADPGLSGTPIDNYVAVGTGTNLTYVYVGTGQLLIGTGTQPVGALLTAGTNIIITSSAGSITIASIDTGLTGTPIDNYVAVGTGTNLTYIYVGTGQLLIGTGTQPVGAPLTAGANVSITSSAGSITISAADPGLSGTPIDNYVAVGTGTNLTYVYVGTGQLLIGTGTQPVGALLTAGTNIIITSSAGSITIASIDTGLTGTPIDNYVAVGTGTNLTYVYVGTGQLLIGTGTQPVGAPLTAGANVSITSSAGSITISAADPGLSGTPIDNYVAVGTGTNLTYVYVGTGQLLIGTGTQPVGALLTAGTNIIITSSAGSITIASIDTGLSGTPIDNYVAVGTGTNLTYVYVGTGQLLIGTGTQPVGAPLTAGANVSITSSAGSITISAADPGLSGTPIDNYVAVGTGTNLTYVYVGTGQLLIGTGTQPVGALLTAGTNIIITSSAGSITIASIDTGLTGTPIDNYVAVGTGTNLTYVYVGTGQLLIGTGTQPVGAPLTAGANVSITSSAGSITISAADPGLTGTPIDNYVAVGTGTNLTYVYVGTGQLLIGTGTQPVGAPLTAGANVSITSSAGSITISAADPGLSGTPIDNYVAVGTGTNLTYVYVGTGQLLIGTGTQPVGAPLTAGANVSITSSAGSITISAADPGLSGTPIDNYVAVGTGTNLTYVYVGTGQLLIGTGTQPVGAPLTAGANVSITSSAGSITISAADPGLTGTPIDNYVAVGTGTNLTYVYVGTGQLLIGTGTQPVGAPLTAGANVSITSSAGSITISAADPGLSGTPIDNYVAVGTGTNLTYVYVGTGQLLIGTGTQPVGALLTAGTNIIITSSAGSITIASIDTGLTGTPIDNYVAVGTGTNLTYIYVGTGQLLIGTGTQPVGAPLTAGANVSITSSAGSITISAADPGLSGTPIDNYVAVGTGTNLTYVYVGTGQLLIGTGTQPVGALLTAGTNIIITSSAGSITIASIDTGLTGTPIDNYVAVGTGTNLTYVYVGTGQLLIGTGTQPVGALLTAGTNIIITSSAGSITIASIDTGLTGTPIDNYVAVGTGTNLTYVYVGTGQLLIGTGTQPVGALLTAGTNIIITSSAGSITIASIDTGLTGTPIDNYVAVGTGTNLTYVYVGTGQLLIGTGTQPVGAPLTAGANVSITSSAGSITISAADPGLSGTPIDNYVAVGTGTNLTYVYVGTGQLLIGTGTQPVGALLTAGTNIIITSSAGSITIASIDTGLTGTPIDNYVAVGTGTNLTYVYVGTGQLLIGTGTQPVGALLTAGTNIIITSSAGSITIASIDTGLTGTPIDNYVAVGTGTNLTYVYVGTGQLLIGTGTQPVGALLTAGTNIIITSSAGSITIASIDTGLTGTPIDNYVAVGTGTNLTYVYVGTGQLLIGTGTQPVGAPLTAGANVSITSSAGSITISAADPGLSGTPIDNYVAVGTGTNLTYVYVGTGQLLIGTGTQPVGAPLTAGANVSITSSAGSITISAADPGLSGTPIDNYVAVGTGTNLTYVYVGTGQLLIGTGTQPVGALLTAGTNIIITSSAGSITIASIDTGLSGTPIDNYVAVGTGTNLTYVYVGTGQLLIGTGTQPVGAPLTAGANVSITSSAGSITISAADPGLSGTPIDNYVAVGTGTNLTYVYVGTGQLLIGTGTQPVGALLTAGTNIIITSSAGSITIASIDTGLTGTPIDNYVAVGTGTNLTYVYVGTGQLLIGTGTQPVGAPLTAGANVSITSSAGSITISAADPGLTGTPIDNYVAVGTGTNLTYVYVGTGQLLIGTGTQPVGAPLTAGANVSITSSAGSITISAADPGLSGTPIDNYVAVGTGTNLTYVYVGTGQLLIGTGTQPVGAPLTAGANVSITSSAGSITISAADPGLSGTPIDNYVAVGTGTNLTYVYVGTGQLLIGTGTQPVGAPLTAGANVSITSSAGSITISAADPGLTGTPIDNYVAVGTGTNLTYVYVGTGQLLIGTGTQPVGAPLTAGANVSITSSAGSITISAADPGLSGTPIDNYVAVGTGTNLTYVYVGTGQLLIGTGTQPVGALLTAGTNIIITSSAGSITIASIDTGLTGTPIDNYVAVGTGTNLTYIYVGTGQLLIGTGTQPVGAPLTAGANVSITSSAGSITISAADPGLSGTPIDNYVAVGTARTSPTSTSAQASS